MFPIVVFQPDARARARLSDALAADHILRPVDTWAELLRTVLTARVSACIVDIYGPRQTISLGRLGRLRERRTWRSSSTPIFLGTVSTPSSWASTASTPSSMRATTTRWSSERP